MIRRSRATPSSDSAHDITYIFHRRSDRSLPIAVRGEGCYLFDHRGKSYLDASGGAAVSCLGHSDQSVIEAIRTQLDHLPYTHARFFTSEPAEKLAAKLAAHAPSQLKKVAFVSSGSEAVEAAIKLSRQYHVERGQPKRHRVIARRRSYHGNTLGALAASDNQQRRAPFEPLLIPFHRIAPCYSYREQEEDETDTDYGIRAAEALEKAIIALDPETVSAFLAETVVGSGLGAVPPVARLFPSHRCNLRAL